MSASDQAEPPAAGCDIVPTVVAQSQSWSQATSIGSTVGLLSIAVAVILFVAARRDRRQEAASHQEREAAKDLHELLAMKGWAMAAVGSIGGGSDYAAWLEAWITETRRPLPLLPPALGERLVVLNYLLERSAALGGPTVWVVAISFAFTEVEHCAIAAIQGAPMPPRVLPPKDRVEELIARGQQLNTGSEPLVEATWHAVSESERRVRRRELRRGMILGACLVVFLASLTNLVVLAT